ncbi:MAG: ester cyclase [Saprospiraceae bacterium]|nr:ester cyclase [Saprospiraceae bacterium]
MVQENENKKFVLKYFKAISHVEKTEKLCDEFMTDQNLKEHIIFFDSIFPGYELIAEEMMSEGNRVMVRARIKGIHKGNFNGIHPTNKKVDFPFVINYTIENEKITQHWMIADQMILMEQLGVANVEAQ